MLIDTAQARDRLRDAGADEDLAGAIIDLWRMTDEAVATKSDVANLRTSIEHEIALVRAETERMRAELTEEIRRAQLETTRSVRAWVAGGVGMIVLLMTLFEFIA